MRIFDRAGEPHGAGERMVERMVFSVREAEMPPSFFLFY